MASAGKKYPNSSGESFGISLTRSGGAFFFSSAFGIRTSENGANGHWLTPFKADL
jgi:hypothetical protein